jgi:hypothetical protein
LFSHCSPGSSTPLPQIACAEQLHVWKSHFHPKGHGEPTSHASPGSSTPFPQAAPAIVAAHRHTVKSHF